MSELKPCPFCSGEVIVVKTAKCGRYIACWDCGCRTEEFETDYAGTARDKAVAAWNRRAQPANEPLVTCGECVKYQTPNCAAKHEQALMDYCSHGVHKPGGEQE